MCKLSARFLLLIFWIKFQNSLHGFFCAGIAGMGIDVHAAEFEYLRNILITWGNANNVNITWVVREAGRLGEYSFPGHEYHPFQPHDFNLRFQLSVKAVTHFPVDPNLPIDHMNADDIADLENKIQARIEHKRNQCASKRKESFMFGLLFLLFALGTTACFLTESYGWMLLELFLSIVFGIAAYSSYVDYRMIKNSSEDGIENEQ